MIILKVSELEKVYFSDMQNFVNRLTADDKYSLPNRDNLKQSIQMQFSQKKKFLLNFALHFRNLHYILKIFKKKMTLVANVFPI